MDVREGCEVRGAWCQMCGPTKSMCFTRCYLKDGVWKYVEGCPTAANNGLFGSVTLCAKGNAAPQSLHSSERLLYPMRRVGSKGPGAHFERIDWDEALDSIASTLLDQKERYGAETFGILSPQFFQVLAMLGRRFLNVHGSPNFLHSGICHVQREVSTATVFGRRPGGPGVQVSASPQQLDRTELLVSWGANPENSEVNHGRLRRRLEAMRRGMKVIDIRPLCDPLAAKADMWLPIRPGTDLALALGFLNVIIGEGLYDHEFVRNWCDGFDELAEHARRFDPVWASAHCGISAETIKKAARMIAAAKPCGIDIGNGVGDQERDGHWTVVAIELIAAICGNVGKPGGGADGIPLKPTIRFNMFSSTLPERLERSDEDIANGWRAGVSRLVAPEFPRWWEGVSGAEPTSSYYRALESVLTGEPYPMRAVFAQATNPLSATRNPRRVAEALSKIDFFFTMDMFHNPSCDYADIVLPAASQYECSHQLAMRNFPEGTFLALSQKVAEPPGEAMSDWEFYLKLAVKMGYGADFWNGDVDAFLDERLAPSGFTAEELRALPEGVFVPREMESPAAVLPAASSDEKVDYADLLSGLPGGKIPCHNRMLAGKPGCDGRTVLSGLPEYRGPAEGIAETPELAREYPFAFSDVHAHRLANHSYFSDIAVLRAFEPDPWVKMNPVAAKRYGIEDGDWVNVESPHGSCVLRARLTEGIAPDVLMGRRGWWQGCADLGRPGYTWEDGGAETSCLYLGDADHSDPFHTAHGKQTLVRIRKHLGDGPRIYACESLPGFGADADVSCEREA